MEFEENETVASKLLRMGAAATGSAASAGVGLAVGGPIGALVGAVSGPIFTEVMSELTDYGARLLSVREQNKIGKLAYIALSNIQSKLDKGYVLREDDFFQENEQAPSNATVIFEAALNKARNEHQDKKIQLYANMFANTCFRTDVSAASADALLNIASAITYRQFCYLEFVRSNEEVVVKGLRGNRHKSLELALLKTEEIQLHHNPLGIYGLLSGPRKEQFVDALSSEGITFVDLAETCKIESSDVYNIAFLLSEVREKP